MRLHRNAIHGLAGLSLFGMAATYISAPQPLIVGPTPIDTLPFVISSPGSYCLVGNLSGNGGILVEADDVDIDLAGFTLEGPGPGLVNHGIDFNLSPRNVRVHDGTLSHWSGHAAKLYTHSVIQNVTARNCGLGFWVDSDSIVDQCTALEIDSTCVVTGARSSITNGNFSSASEDHHVVWVGDSSTILDTRAAGGSACFSGASGVHLERCSARLFRSAGFEFEDRNVVIDCQANSAHTADAIRAGDHSRIDRCRIEGIHGRGIVVGASSQVVDCSVSESSFEAIRIQQDSRVSGCVVHHGNMTGISEAGGIRCTTGAIIENTVIAHSQGAGILVEGNSARITDNLLINNSGPGLVLNRGGLAAGNTIQRNSEEGILVKNEGNVLRDNLVDENGFGVRLEAHSNLLTGNRVRANSNGDFDMVWGNAHGPIRPADAQILGSHPQANYGND